MPRPIFNEWDDDFDRFCKMGDWANELEACLGKMYDQFWLTSENPGDDGTINEAKRLLGR